MIDGQAAASLAALMSEWVSASMDWHWNGIDRLFDLLEVAAPPGDRSADPTFWRLRLVALQLLGRRKEFLAAAAEMQALYGDASPAWETPRRVVRQGTPSKDAGGSEFMVSTMPDALGRDRAGRIDLAGQLTGDIASALARCDSELREAEIITVDCTRLIRVDFVAAGELINWVAEQRARQRLVHFRQLHRLLALFFRAMGLDEHATLEMRGTSLSAGMAS
jgi:ABC-type transporter Mla MlaB component